MFKSLVSLLDLDLSNNSLTGMIPDTIGLPAFLRFSTVLEYQLQDLYAPPEWGAMRCPALQLSIRGNTITSNVGTYAGVVQQVALNLDPIYYMFEGCACEQGYNLQSVQGIQVGGPVPVFACIAIGHSWLSQNLWILAVIVGAGILMITWLAYVNMRKRIRTEPLEGILSVVNTDIEGYSDMMKESPELMNEALGIHNSLIRKAKWVNFGHTMEQEGDSFTVGFYEAADAVSFCLMAQQQLHNQAWPKGLIKEDHCGQIPRKRSSSSRSIFENAFCRIGLFPSSAASSISSTARGVVPPGALGDAELGSMDFEEDAQVSALSGLRVRMGVATGHVAKGGSSTDGCNSLMARAKVVADAGAGGQVLMDEATFLTVKERLAELGAVDENGLNLKKLHRIRPLCCWWSHARTDKDDTVLEAMVLHMGTYDKGPNDKKKEAHLELYQILPPKLKGRAKMFGSKLTLKDEWTCVDSPFFSAPGTLSAQFCGGGIARPSDGPPPMVTMVFTCVENGKILPRHVANIVNNLITHIVQKALTEVNGGYLCRIQGGDLKYMLAFSNPKAALIWCLTVQEAMLFVDWSPEVLKYEKFGVVRQQEDGSQPSRLLFRGPRLKMGVCEGRVESIFPDHMGRADYHGPSVNQAARFMDAGAHGGQVVCEETLALCVLQDLKRPSSLYNVLGSTLEGAMQTSVSGSAISKSSQHGAMKATLSPDNGHSGRKKLPGPIIVPPTAPLANTVHSPQLLVDGKSSPSLSKAHGSSRMHGGRPSPSASQSPGGRHCVRDLSYNLPAVQEGREDIDISGGGAAFPSLQVPIIHLEQMGVVTMSPSDKNQCLSATYHPSEESRLAVKTMLEVQGSTIQDFVINQTVSEDQGNLRHHDMGSAEQLLAAGSATAFQEPPIAITSLDRAPQQLSPGVVFDLHDVSSTALSGSSQRVTDEMIKSSNTEKKTDLMHSVVSSGTSEVSSASQLVSSLQHSELPSGLGQLTKQKLTTGCDLSASDPSFLQGILSNSYSIQHGCVHVDVNMDLQQPINHTALITNSAEIRAQNYSTFLVEPQETEVLSRSDLTTLKAFRIGTFRFKGSNDGLKMAYLTTEQLEGRQFPSDPPKGKGNRISTSSGLLCSVGCVQMPGIVLKLKQQHESSEASVDDNRPVTKHTRTVLKMMGSTKSSPNLHPCSNKKESWQTLSPAPWQVGGLNHATTSKGQLKVCATAGGEDALGGGHIRASLRSESFLRGAAFALVTRVRSSSSMMVSASKFNQSSDHSDEGMQIRNSRSTGGGLTLHDVQEVCDEM
ncbi:hypothetical protein CEUSTIGMA_g2029.t1 [Chlamydomonas eustigma]|uniref:Guanylate cyclase domain-containing protein n=1 Tax=Chlamydomonas eustigma TaxID=1157962 RepID=A0A250WVM2_9CHLO|nr:hypothetical protein CEUSTIGMA_g2029.t1 [Chlamydomonas eustigma]|eukprot:GAX74580.1 hypothetical protein CEUSTIGMA_g2029.t1 [Chlamydomonas eustigma]